MNEIPMGISPWKNHGIKYGYADFFLQEYDSMKDQVFNLRETINKIKKIVHEQAKDEGLWFISERAPEAYLQQELRKLHAVIEGGDDE